MSKLAEHPKRLDQDQEAEAKGPNLFLLYGFLVLALLGAMAVAAMIVWPFYLRR